LAIVTLSNLKRIQFNKEVMFGIFTNELPKLTALQRHQEE
jgi:hypothetical protein